MALRWEEVKKILDEKGDLKGVELKKAKLKGVNLKGVDLSKANLSGADLSNSNLEGANLSGVVAKDANFRKANLSKAIVEGADLSKARLQSAKISSSRWIDVNFSGADMSGLDASELEFFNCNFSGTIASESSWREVKFTSCKLIESDFSISNFENCEFSESDLNRSDFYGVKVNNVKFEQSNLERADFSASKMTNLTIENSKLEGTNFKGVKGLSESELKKFKAQGALISSLIVKKLVRSRPVQIALAVLVVAFGLFLIMHFSNPQNWSRARIQDAMYEAMSKGDFQKAEKLAKIGLEKSKDTQHEPMFLNVLASIYEQTRRTSEAEEIYKKIIKDFSHYSNFAFDAELSMARIESARDPDKAIETLKRIIADYSPTTDVWRAYELLTNVYLDKGDSESALALADKFVAENKDDPDLYVIGIQLKARIFHRLGRYEEAAALMEQVLDKAQDENIKDSAWFELASIYIQGKMFDKYEAHLKKLTPKQKERKERLAQLDLEYQRAKGDKTAAKEILLGMLKEKGFPRRDALSQLIWMELEDGNLEQAGRYIAQLKSEYEKSKPDVNALLTLMGQQVELARRKRDFKEAIRLKEEAYQIAKKANPKSEMFISEGISLMFTYMDNGELEKASKIVKELEENAPSELKWRVLEAKGHMAMRTQRFDEATQYFSEAIKSAKGGREPICGSKMNLIWAYVNNTNRTQKDTANAKTLIKEILESEECADQKFPATQAMVSLLSSERNFKEALEFLGQHELELSQRTDSKLWMLQTKSNLLEELGAKPDAILETYEQAVKQAPKGSDDYFNVTLGLAQAYRRFQKPERACQLYKDIGESESARTEIKLEALMRYAECLVDSNDVAQIDVLLNKLKEMVDKSSNRLDYLPQLARVYSRLQRFDEASKLLDSAVSALPAGTYKEMLAREFAENIWQSGKRAEAIAKYKEILNWCNSRSGDCLDLQIRIAQMYWENQDVKGVEETLTPLVGSEKPDKRIWFAYSMFADIKRSRGDREGALELLSKAEKLVGAGSNELCQLQMQRSNIFVDLRKFNEALNACKLAAQGAKDIGCKGNAMLCQAEVLKISHKYDDALKVLQSIISGDFPREIKREANFKVGAVYYERGEIDKAKDFYNNLIETTEDPIYRASYMSNLASLLFNAGRSDEAKVLFEKVISDAKVPIQNKAWTYIPYLELLISNGLYKDVIKVIEGVNLAQFEPNARVEILVRYGEALIKENRLEQAESVLTEALKLNPNPDLTNRIRAALANIYSLKGNKESSIENYKRLTSLPVTNPQGAIARFELGKLYIQTGRLTEAEDVLSDLFSAEKLPKTVDRNRVADMLFECLLTLNRAKETEAFLTELEKKTAKPDDLEKLNSFWARYLARLGRQKEAFERYQELLKNPKSPYYYDALEFVAKYHLSSGKPEKAIAMASSALTNKNLSAENVFKFTFIIASAHRELGQLDEAKKLLVRWLKGNEASAPKAWLKDVYMQLGYIESADQNYSSAIAYYRKAGSVATEAKDKALAKIEETRAYIGWNRLGGAEKALNESNKLFPQDFELIRQIAELRLNIASKRGKPEQVLETLDELEKSSSSREEELGILLQKAIVYKTFKMQSERLKTLERLSQLLQKDDPRRLPILMELADIYVGMGESQKAEAVYAQVSESSKSDPTSGWAKLELANIAMEKGEWSRANELFLQILSGYEQTDFLVAAISELRQSYLLHDRKADFVSICNDLIKKAINPDIKLLSRAYLVWLRSNELPKEQAIGEMNSILSELGARDDLVAWDIKLTAARFLDAIGDKSGAIAKYQELISQAKQKPWSVISRVELAKLLEERGHYREALALNKQLLKLTDSMVDLNLSMDVKVSIGRLYAKLGEHQKAVESYKEVADYEPNTFRGAKAKEEMAYSLFALGKNSIAEKMWQELLERFKDDSEIQVSCRMRLGELYVTTKRYAEAERVYRYVLEKYKNDWRYGFAMLNLSKALYGQGNVSDAKKLLEQILKVYKDEKLLKEAKGLLNVVNSGAPLSARFNEERRV